MNGLTIRVPTGTKSEYLFRASVGGVIVDTCSRGSDLTSSYHYFDTKGTTAIRRLMEKAEMLERIATDVRKLAIFDDHGRLTGFVEPSRDMETEQEAAFERLAETLEEQAELEGIE
jgi:hypothetical protein